MHAISLHLTRLCYKSLGIKTEPPYILPSILLSILPIYPLNPFSLSHSFLFLSVHLSHLSCIYLVAFLSYNSITLLQFPCYKCQLNCSYQVICSAFYYIIPSTKSHLEGVTQSTFSVGVSPRNLKQQTDYWLLLPNR